MAEGVVRRRAGILPACRQSVEDRRRPVRLGKPWTGLLAVIGLWAAASTQAAPAPSSLPDDPAITGLYTQPQTLVRLPAGRRIHLICLGEGAPTVILTAGTGGWSGSWRKVQAEVAQVTRVCAWDRPGFGYSDPSPEVEDAAHTVLDLEQALFAARIGGPYVMVGHSGGAFETLLFTDRHRGDVAGMVLVDPSIPNQTLVARAVAPRAAVMVAASDAAEVAGLRRCGAQVAAGKVHYGGPDPDHCFTYPASYPAALQAALAARDGDPALNPARALTKASLMQNFAASAEEAYYPGRDYGDLPLRVLTASRARSLPGAPPEVAAEGAAWGAAWLQAHDAYAALSTRGHNDVVEGAGHNIQGARPDVVIAATLEVIGQAREDMAGAPR